MGRRQHQIKKKEEIKKEKQIKYENQTVKLLLVLALLEIIDRLLGILEKFLNH